MIRSRAELIIMLTIIAVRTIAIVLLVVRVEDNHDLGFWCVNFLDRAATPAVKHLRHIAEKTKENLARPEQAETLQKRPREVLNRQVGELLRSSLADISASEIAGRANK